MYFAKFVNAFVKLYKRNTHDHINHINDHINHSHGHVNHSLDHINHNKLISGNVCTLVIEWQQMIIYLNFVKI